MEKEMIEDDCENNEEFEIYYNIPDIGIAVTRCIKVYGIEGTEEIINEVYKHRDLQGVREQFLTELYKRYKFKK